ncbi:MAG: ATP-dependent Clp protease adaptor ClpS [Sulfurovaceae bacterium]|nr:ATP-dependent Clp protease adaptor ClpS [Sulfurovaceae bacterium]
MPKTDVSLETIYALDDPKKYKVILHNDHYTSMDFVIHVLTSIFHKNAMEAQEIMLQIHEKGKGTCGIYTYEIAQTKVAQVSRLAKQNGFPLLATMEEE